jgi:Lrp/AsnC family transcriptional regulator, leucine-responsive regulatory protein
MDDKDRLLIAALSTDARRPIVALARDVSLSRSATQDRLARLVASGAIAKFTIVEGQAGEARQTAHLLVKLEKGFKCAQVVPKIMACHAASAVHSVAGEHDLVVRLDAVSLDGIEAARASLAAVTGIASIVTMVSLQKHLG